MKKISWGVLGTSKFAERATIPATQKSRYSEVTAIASRDASRAANLATRLRIQKSYGSYEELLEDGRIDAVYIPLPNHLHVEWTLKALEAGKHVLCEKPIGVNFADSLRLKDAARNFPGLKVMEAFMYRHHPQWKKAMELIEKGTVGEIRSVHSVFAYFNDDPSNIRNRREVGGGGMLDIGCYCTSLSRFIFKSEPNRVLANVEYDPRTGTDRLASGVLDFGEGVASFLCGTQLQRHQTVDIHGTEGRIEIKIPFNPPNDRPTAISVYRGESVEQIDFEICDQYTIQVDLFAQAILENRDVPTPLEDAFANMKVIDAVFESSRKGGWVSL